MPQPPPPPGDPPVIFNFITGANVKVNFFGVGEDNAYLNPTGVGPKRGPKGKAEYTFTKLIALDMSEPTFEKTLGSFANFLKRQLGGSLIDLCSQEIKVIKITDGVAESVSPFQMLGLDTPIAL